MITASDLHRIPYEKTLELIREFIVTYYEKSRVSRVVMGLSGGLDSSVLLTVLVKALSGEKVLALIMPDTRATPVEDVEDAVELARSLGVEYHLITIDPIVDSYRAIPILELGENLAIGNLRARVRMNILYYYANRYDAIVAGSSDRSELLLGYYTKYGDGAVDFLPLGCLYKTQVRELGKRLGVPLKIISKPSAPRLYRGHMAQSELGYSYDEIDLALYALFDLGLDIEEAVRETGLSRELFNRVLELHRRSRHKRTFPPMPSLPWSGPPLREI